MKTWKSFVALIAILGTGAVAAFGQGTSPRRGTIVVPDSSLQRAADVGVRAHTNHLIFVPAGGKLVLSNPSGETPGSLACIYELPTAASGLGSGCPTSDFLNISSSGSSGSGIIAIVDAYHYPTAPQDFAKFSSTFHLPSGNSCNGGKACFTQVAAAKGNIKTNSGWALEAALDIEWAHAMAPTAQIVLVEAASNSNSNLFDAVDLASQIVACGSTSITSCPGNGTGEVSMSWGGSEFSGETGYDSHFSTPGVVYTAASGDSGGVVIYPSASPYVLSAGGTTIDRDSSNNYSGETAWSSSGGGPSAYEAEPPYQQSYVSTVTLNGMRGTPDFSYDADPSSGVSVYDSTSYQGLTGWFTIGGTSVASPSLAGIINLAASSGGSFAPNTGTELTNIYQDYSSGFNPNTNSYSSDFRDITFGTTSGCGGGGGGNPHHKSKTSSTTSSCYSAQPGWDFITGVGTNLGTAGK